jgi:nicotinamide-nucleotide amidase
LSPFPPDIVDLCHVILDACRAQGMMIATAESCTGGLVAGALTAIPGSSDVLDRGFVTYSNAAKQAQLGVSEGLLAEYGAVSEPVARTMAEGALSASTAQLAVSVTGIAGPGGGSAEKPVGLVHFAAARTGHPTVHRAECFGDIGRDAVRMASVRVALEMLRAAI